MSAEQRLTVSSEIRNEAFQGVNNWDASEDEDKDQEEEKLPNAAVGGDVLRHKLLPRDDRAEEYEKAGVEHHVDDGWEGERAGFLGEPAVVRESYTCSECDKEIVTAED